MLWQPLGAPVAPVTAKVEVKQVVETVVPVKVTPVAKPVSTEARVREYFKDIPDMIEIARCESRFRQFVNGEVLRGIQNPQDVGVMQINEHYHLAASKRLGFNIYTLEGNMRYARYLYEREGTRPWGWSKPCHGK